MCSIDHSCDHLLLCMSCAEFPLRIYRFACIASPHRPAYCGLLIHACLQPLALSKERTKALCGVNGRFLVTSEDNASSVCWQLDDDEEADDEQSVWMTIRYACAANLLYVSSYALANDHALADDVDGTPASGAPRSLALVELLCRFICKARRCNDTAAAMACRREVEWTAATQPLLSNFLYNSILAHDSFEKALASVLSNRLANTVMLPNQLFEIIHAVLISDPNVREGALADVEACRDRVSLQNELGRAV